MARWISHQDLPACLITRRVSSSSGVHLPPDDLADEPDLFVNFFFFERVNEPAHFAAITVSLFTQLAVFDRC